MSYLENDPNNFILVLRLNHVKKISRGGWSGFGMETVGIHPNDFRVLNGHPNKIPTNEVLGDVVKNCLLKTGIKYGSRGQLTRTLKTEANTQGLT